MAGKTQNSVVNIRTSKATREDMKQLRQLVQGLNKDIKLVKKSFQDLSVLTQRTQAATPGFFRGKQARAGASAQRTAFAGTKTGREAESLRLVIQREKTALNLRKERQKRSEAINFSIKRETEAVRKLTSQAELKARMQKAELRVQIEAGRNAGRRVNAAQKLVSTIRQRIQELKDEQSVLRQNAKLTDKQRGDKARRDARERLFGDGGANLFSIQAGLIANFALIGGLQSGLRNAVTFTVELDEALRNLQAIVRVTDTNLNSLKNSLIQISEETKFTAVEVANAAVTLGQAGFSVDEIQASVRSVTLLATATGTDLPRAVDIATSVLGVFGLQSSEMGRVADVMTAAVNNSKLNIEKLALGLQFSGNVAAQSGLRFEELTSALGAMANAGIRSGSTLGTGMRQILISLQKPSGEFKATLDRLGLTMADVDIKSKGLAGVLMTLSEAGFTSSDAIRAFEVRAASAFNALSNNVDKMLSLEASFVNTTAAAAANETQMRSLANQGRRLASVLGTVAAVGLDPMKEALIPVTSAISDALSFMKEFDGIIQAVTISLTLFTAAIGTLLLGRLIKNLVLIALGGQTVAGAMGAASTATAGFTLTSRISLGALTAWTAGASASAIATTALTATLAALRAAMMFFVATPLGLMLTGLTAVTAGLVLFGRRTSQAASDLEEAQTAFDRTAGAAEEMRKKISSVDGEIEELVNRQDSLRNSSALMDAAIGRVQNQFTNMGKDASGVGDTVETLIGSLQSLRAELAQEFKLKLDEEGVALDKLLEVQKENLAASVTKNQRAGAVSPGVIPSGSQLLVDNPNGRAVSSELQRTINRQSELRSLQSDGKASQEDLAELADLTLRRKALEGISKQLIAIFKTEQEIEEVRKAQTFAADLFDPVVGKSLAKADVLAEGARNRAAGALNSGDLTARERVALVEAEKIAFEAEMALLRSSAESAGAGEQSLKQIDDRIANGLGEFTRVAAMASGNFEKVEEGLAKLDIAALQNEIDGAVSQVSQAQNETQVGVALNRQIAAIQALAKKEIEEIQRTTSDPELRDAEIAAREAQLERDTVEALTGASGRINKLGEETQKETARVEEANREVRLSLLENQKRALLNRLEEAKSLDETEALQQQLLEVQGQIAEEQRARDAAAQNLTEDERTAQRASSFLEFVRIAAEIRRKVAEQSKEITDKAGDEKEFADDLIKQMNDQVRMQRLILFFGEDSLEVAKERARVERENFVAMVKTKVESEALRKKMIAVFDAGRRFQNLDFGKPIRNALGAAGRLLSKLARAGRAMAVLDSEGRETQIRLDTINRPGERAARLQEKAFRDEAGLGPDSELSPLQQTLLDEQKKRARENALARERLLELESESSKGGGGGGTKKERDEALRKLLAKLENAGDAAQIGVDTGSLSSARGIKIQEGALGETQAALAEREKLIAQISQSANRTADEEERLTVLLEEHEAITRSIEEQEKRISAEKGRQGILQFDLTRSVKDWADANLDVNATLQSGLSGTLSSMTSGFSELFQKLSTEPKKAGQAFLGFARTVAQAMQQAIAEMMAVFLMQKLIGMLPGVSGDGSFLGSLKAGIGLKAGGPVRKAGGGEVEGNLARDSQPHLLMPGEFVLRKSAAQAVGIDNLREINALGNRRMASGGHVGAGNGLGQSKTQNLWLVDERSKAPVPGPEDIVAVISDDISRDGSTGQLIRQISEGGR